MNDADKTPTDAATRRGRRIAALNRNATIPYLETAVADHEERGNQDDQRVLAVVRGADKTKALFPPARLLKKP